MKLGTETGSLVNHIMSICVTEEVKVGDGATVLGWTDRDPATVIEVNKKYIVVQMDNYKRIDDNGMSECQAYEYSRNPEGACYMFKKDRNGKWVRCVRNEATGRLNIQKYGGLMIGERSRYYDFSF